MMKKKDFYSDIRNLQKEIVAEIVALMVEHDVTEEEYREWSDYCVEASEFGFDTPNLKSWHMRCPRTPQETFDHLRRLKKDLADAVEEEKKRIKK
jgi:hypothetical protein